jgi:serine/threonine protein kinase
LQVDTRRKRSMSNDPFNLVGSTVCGHYAVESLVAEGGFSVVYRARHTLWNRPVAIKAFHGVDGLDVEARDEMIRAFVQEGAMLAELSERTTAIVQARDMATVVTPAGDWVPFLVLEWLEGECLESVLWRERQALLPTRSLAQAFELLDPVAKALSLAHAKGICHRDLKPGNIFVLGDPRGTGCATKLLDFGVASFFSDAARASRDGRRPTGSYAFTPAYAAPEQFCDAYGVTGPWTDVFALALIMTELMVGHGPVGPSPAARASSAAAHASRRATPGVLGACVPASAERVFARAVSVFPAERWQTVGTFWEALGRAISPSSTIVRSHVPHARPSAAAPPVLERNRARAGVATLGLVALAIGATAASDVAVRRHAGAAAPVAAPAHAHSSAGLQSPAPARAAAAPQANPKEQQPATKGPFKSEVSRAP